MYKNEKYSKFGFRTLNLRLCLNVMKRDDIQFFSRCLLLCTMLLSYGCGSSVSQLEKVIERGKLRVVTHSGPATYYADKDGKNGFEYELASQFAESLGVELELIVVKNIAQVERTILRAEADVAAGNIKSRDASDSILSYANAYHWVTRQLIYRKSHSRPSTFSDLAPDKLHLTAGMIPVEILEKIQANTPSFDWQFHEDKDDSDLMRMVQNGEIFYALAYSNDMLLARSTNPDVRPAFTFTHPKPLAWAVKRSPDTSLLDEINKFYKGINESGRLADLVEEFYGPSGFFDYVDSRTFIRKLRSTLPELKPYFKRSAEKHDIDWRLLAALSYQESHWNKLARSRTGVRGLMMLTQPTAKQVGVKDRLDPEQSIEGGTKYLISLIKRIPPRIPEPDRTWFALAAYNVGFGHLEDARILTEKDGANPDVWEDVKRRLPLLSKRKWHRQTRHGYARGHEPVKFVSKIRKYYNVLVQLNQETPENSPQVVEAISIDSPVL